MPKAGTGRVEADNERPVVARRPPGKLRPGASARRPAGCPCSCSTAGRHAPKLRRGRAPTALHRLRHENEYAIYHLSDAGRILKMQPESINRWHLSAARDDPRGHAGSGPDFCRRTHCAGDARRALAAQRRVSGRLAGTMLDGWQVFLQCGAPPPIWSDDLWAFLRNEPARQPERV